AMEEVIETTVAQINIMDSITGQSNWYSDYMCGWLSAGYRSGLFLYDTAQCDWYIANTCMNWVGQNFAITSVDLGAMNIAINPLEDNILHVQVSTNDSSFGYMGSNCSVASFYASGSCSADLTLDLFLSATVVETGDPANPTDVTFTLLENQSNLSMSDFDHDSNSFLLDLLNIIGLGIPDLLSEFLVTYLFNADGWDEISGAVKDAIDQGLFDAMDIPMHTVDFVRPKDNQSVGLTVLMDAFSAGFSANDINLELFTHYDVTHWTKEFTGSVADTPTSEPNWDPQYDLHFSLADNTMNQLMYVLWGAGFFDYLTELPVPQEVQGLVGFSSITAIVNSTRQPTLHASGNGMLFGMEDMQMLLIDPNTNNPLLSVVVSVSESMTATGYREEQSPGQWVTKLDFAMGDFNLSMTASTSLGDGGALYTDPDVNSLIELVLNYLVEPAVVDVLSQVNNNIVFPSFNGFDFAMPSVNSTSGYLRFETNLINGN
ncbi:MAG: hypothetical protein QGI45_00425, partial [Myxococcota bacterium]|nr:hypothetical protein [Myxococcota bacterium]